jgi:crotonobetainyl-CoA:carnitine CoA-transferase CaiB-like acyl-CoA transferase
MAHNAGRIVHEKEIDEALGLWCAAHSSVHIINTLEGVRVPVGPIYSVVDMMSDPQYQARGLFESVEIDGKPLKIPAILPKLDATPGRTDWPGLAIGSHNDEVLRGILQLDDARIEQLRADGVIG